MQTTRSGKYRSRMLQRPYSYAGENSTKPKCVIVYGILKNLKYKYGNRKFWCRGYYVDTVGKNAKKIEEYIKNQLQDDIAYDQLSLKEFIDPFTGEPVIKGK